ncbi:hypothetical protein CDV52_17145 [Haematobacter missouriensis]|uniref:Uncharacterized protein n=1 Tax=Haematobacter missouriensis TaxID=366616 RepID=A0A212AJV0_9RHOB|nr:hypothetical protein CDV52_17145 [Haematobacter missouriensis]
MTMHIPPDRPMAQKDPPASLRHGPPQRLHLRSHGIHDAPPVSPRGRLPRNGAAKPARDCSRPLSDRNVIGEYYRARGLLQMVPRQKTAARNGQHPAAMARLQQTQDLIHHGQPRADQKYQTLRRFPLPPRLSHPRLLLGHWMTRGQNQAIPRQHLTACAAQGDAGALALHR